MENKPSGGRFIAALLFFATTAGIAILLLLTALVIWLSSVTGSFIASALIAGGFFAVLALLVYLFAIRDAVEQIRRQAETVYEVAHAAQTGYEWLAGKVSLFLKLREELQKNEKSRSSKLLRLFQAFREGLRRHLRTDPRRTGLSNLLRTAFPISAVRVSA